MSSQPSPGAKRATGLAAFWASYLKSWSSVKLAVVLMLSIAVAAILGTVVPQGDVTVIQQLETSEFTKRFLLAIHANQVYYSPWFLTLLALFFLNLLASTTRVAIPRLRVALRRPPDLAVEVRRRHHGNQVVLPAQPIEPIALAFRKAGYRVYPGRDGGIIAHKGRWSRFAPLVTHLGLFGILIGGLTSGLTSFKAFVPLFPGESVSAREIVEQHAQPRGPLASAEHDFTIRADKFWIDWYDQDTIHQYNSNLTVLHQGQEVATKTIWVNEPLVHDGMWFYQSSWGVGKLKMEIAGKPAEPRMAPASPYEGFLSDPVPAGKEIVRLYLMNTQQPLEVLKVNMAEGRFESVAKLTPGQTITVDGVPLRFLSPVMYTGLQVKADPGIPVVYTGFLVLILGSALAFFAVRQVWVGPTADGGYLVSGKANRGHYAFQRELARLATQLGAKNHVPDAT